MLTLGTKLQVEEVPLAALEEQHRSTDPLQKTLAALMIAYAKGSHSRQPGNRAPLRRHASFCFRLRGRLPQSRRRTLIPISEPLWRNAEGASQVRRARERWESERNDCEQLGATRPNSVYCNPSFQENIVEVMNRLRRPRTHFALA